jgi:hypothetical protein
MKYHEYTIAGGEGGGLPPCLTCNLTLTNTELRHRELGCLPPSFDGCADGTGAPFVYDNVVTVYTTPNRI